MHVCMLQMNTFHYFLLISLAFYKEVNLENSQLTSLLPIPVDSVTCAHFKSKFMAVSNHPTHLRHSSCFPLLWY